MTLEELSGEIQALQMAYPGTTKVFVRDTRFSANTTEISVVRVESNDTVVVVLEGV